MAHSSSTVTIVAAIVGNFAIAVTKFVAAALTGSSAMLSEGIHSTVDTGNDLLLLLGMRLSKRPPNENHPFGYGSEVYFWSLIVGIMIFGVGGGISTYEGILHLKTPPEITSPITNYIVIGISVVFEGTTWVFALRTFLQVKGGASFWQEIRSSKDPTTFVVLFEDSAALLGLAFAFLGIYLGELWQMPRLDAVASILIGLLLAGASAILIFETRSLLIGESADPETVADIRKLAQSDPGVDRIGARSPCIWGLIRCC